MPVSFGMFLMNICATTLTIFSQTLYINPGKGYIFIYFFILSVRKCLNLKVKLQLSTPSHTKEPNPCQLPHWVLAHIAGQGTERLEQFIIKKT